MNRIRLNKRIDDAQQGARATVVPSLAALALADTLGIDDAPEPPIEFRATLFVAISRGVAENFVRGALDIMANQEALGITVEQMIEQREEVEL